MANRNDVAQKAGVSGATVSRVFNNPGSVSPETRERVLQTAREMDYHPNIIASNFVRGISGNIGVVIPHIPNVHIFSVYYFSEILSGIGEALEERGYNLLLLFNRVEDGQVSDYTRFFTGGKVDGCILLGTRRNDTGLLKLKEAGYDFCLVNNYIRGSEISFIDIDNVKGSFEAVEYLIGLGHRDIVFLNGPSSFSNSADREAGYIKALNKYGIPVRKEYILEGNYGKKSGYQAAANLLAMSRLPTAVFAGNDRMAAGLMQGLKEKKIRVPDDISIIGYDDSDTAVIVDPQLTTVKIPFFELGKRCVDEFINTLIGENAGEFSVFIDPELVIRESAAKLVENP